MAGKVDMARAVIALALGALTILLAIAQFSALIANSRKGRGYSFVPFIGAILGVAACLVAPWRWSNWLLPATLVLDPTPPLFLWAFVTRLK